MDNVLINYTAVVVAAIASMVLGFLWYGPVFGKTWIRLSKFSEADMNQAKAQGMGKYYFAAFIGALVTAYVLAHFVSALDIVTAGEAIMLAVWVWLGFIATTTLSSVLWEGKSKELYFLNNAHNLVNMIIMSLILTLWGI